jgi:CRISPR-associated exonuclease Cas4
VNPGLIPVILLIGLLLLAMARLGRKASGLPQGQITYCDTGANAQEKPLFSARHRLTGRPDYLVHKDNHIIPVELKSGRAPERPYRSHILQLAAYCLLTEEVYRKRPPYGIIRYSNAGFEIDYTNELERELLGVLEEMRADMGARDVSRSHNQPYRCAHCGYRNECDNSLAPPNVAPGLGDR